MRNLKKIGLSLALLGMALASCTTAKLTRTASGVTTSYHYAVNLRQLEQHRLRVSVQLPPTRNKQAVFVLPKVVPGIYGTMNFGQYVADFAAFDLQDKPLAVVRQDTNSWAIAEASRLHHLTYTVSQTWEEFSTTKGRVPAFYRSAGSSYHPDSAFVLNYSTFIGYLDGQSALPYQVRFTKPTGFYGASYLTPQPLNDTTDVVQAPTYRELVDAPVLYARPDTAWIQLGSTRVLVALYDAAGKQPYAPVLARSLKTMLEAQRAYLGGTLPVEKYTFLIYYNQHQGAGRLVGDGLEHNHSTLCLLESPDRDNLANYVRGIASHEFFHVVTPLNIHARQIEDYDFRRPIFSEHLWLYEGLTEYETIHMPIREKLETLPEFLATLKSKAKAMSQYDDTLSLTQLSRQVSTRQDQFYNFYLKGTLFNLCLDIKLRELSGGKLGTQELIQLLLRRYGPHKPFVDDQLFDSLTQLTFPQMRDFFRDYLESGKPLPLAETLAKVGMAYDAKDYTISLVDHPTPTQLALRRAWIGQ
ncbi:M61 family metallopeptidase [Spirosoma flavum]|uniref:Peptidase M61 n=1 Tax=Spirosoma flavum TaxID=2048557 RepID=A0ABW6AHM3_9BACT